MDVFLEDLFEKRGSTRENALFAIVKSLSVSCQYQFAKKNFATLLYRCLSSFKKGSFKESCLALDALGLLALTIGCGDDGDEIYRETLPLLSEALKSGSESAKLKPILNCLAIVAFVGANDSLETQRVMQCIWTFLHSDSGYKESAVQSAAISAWSFLLSTMDGWTVSYKLWQRAIPFFLDLLEAEDESLCVVAGEALALVSEKGSLEKFSSCDERNSGSSLEEVFVSQVKILSVKAEHESLEYKHSTNSKSKWHSMKLLKDGCFHEHCLKLGEHLVKLNSWSQLLQLNFLKRFLGPGFVRHMLENELLHDVFNIIREKQPERELYVSEREEVSFRYFERGAQPKRSNIGDFYKAEKICRAPSIDFRKARTQFRSKNRDVKANKLQLSSD